MLRLIFKNIFIIICALTCFFALCVYLSIAIQFEVARDFVKQLIEFGFITAVSAFAGVLGAQHILDRQVTKRKIDYEIIRINKALAIIEVSQKEFIRRKEKILQFYSLYKKEQSSNEDKTLYHQIRPGLMTAPNVCAPIERLADIIDDHLLFNSKIALCSAMLRTDYQTLVAIINAYNSLTDDIRNHDVSTDSSIKKRWYMYYGHVKKNGVSDKRYSNLLNDLNIKMDAQILILNTLRLYLVARYEDIVQANSGLREKCPITSVIDYCDHSLFPDKEKFDDYKAYLFD